LLFITGVPEPALSEPAQQLIGARSGGERGYYRTTTPRFGEKFDFVSVEREEKKGKINKKINREKTRKSLPLSLLLSRRDRDLDILALKKGKRIEDTSEQERSVSRSLGYATMVKTFQAYLPSCHRTYSCIHCRAHLANHDELISKVSCTSSK